MRKHGGKNSFSFVSTGIDLTSENAILVRGADDFFPLLKGSVKAAQVEVHDLRVIA